MNVDPPASGSREFQWKNPLLLSQTHHRYQRLFGFIKGNPSQAHLGLVTLAGLRPVFPE
jgi:hypothetical protein